ncbi:MAG: signal recognition particle-docking protein FtsY [Spirochaetes bacterium]|nr:signal recognition particle-docking protein FtsY [Spirochaetota bacterium]
MGLFSNLFSRPSSKGGSGFSLKDIFFKTDETLYKTLEERLIAADTGLDLTREIVTKLRTIVTEQHLREPDDIKKALRAELRSILRDGTLALSGPTLLFIVGVNGVGKTTTIAKLATLLKQDHSVLLVGADTFRAAATEQLTVWAERVGVDIVKGQPASDPAAVLFDGMTKASARSIDLVIADTAGRFHNKDSLMRQLEKMKRIAVEKFPPYRFVPLLVLDATVGQNGFEQAKVFTETVSVSGVVLSKFDASAKGGVVFAVNRSLNLPVLFAGTGEKATDIITFDPDAFVAAVVGE